MEWEQREWRRWAWEWVGLVSRSRPSGSSSSCLSTHSSWTGSNSSSTGPARLHRTHTSAPTISLEEEEKEKERGEEGKANLPRPSGSDRGPSCRGGWLRDSCWPCHAGQPVGQLGCLSAKSLPCLNHSESFSFLFVWGCGVFGVFASRFLSSWMCSKKNQLCFVRSLPGFSCFSPRLSLNKKTNTQTRQRRQTDKRREGRTRDGVAAVKDLGEQCPDCTSSTFRCQECACLQLIGMETGRDPKNPSHSSPQLS